MVIVTRSDLTYGEQAVQSTHAAINFCFEHRNRAGPWFENSNYLVQLSTSNEAELLKLIEKCDKLEISYTVFREPDLNDSITAIAIEPSPLTKKVVSHLPLLFKNKN